MFVILTEFVRATESYSFVMFKNGGSLKHEQHNIELLALSIFGKRLILHIFFSMLGFI